MKVFILLALLLWKVHHASAKAAFAHFMVSNAFNYTLSDWTNEINLAKAAKIDAFALNTAYNQGDDPQYANAFSAANSAGFKLFFSFDYAGNGPFPKDTVLGILNKYRSNGAHYTFRGKPFVSTFEGPRNAADWIDIKAQTGCFFVPDWSSAGAKSAMELGGGVADGLFSWAAWPWGNQDMDTYVDASYLQFLKGKPYMMAVSPWFYTNLPGYDKNWLWRGDDLWFDRWQEVLYVQPEWIQIVSWNDYGESHYIGPVVTKALGALRTGRAPYNFVENMPHDAWRETLAFSIDMYVRNTTTITKEKVVFWYRIQPAAACNSGGTTGNTASQLQVEFPAVQVVQDKVFYTAMLGSAADVFVSIGGNRQAGTWSDTPDGGIGLYHGSAPLNGRLGQVIVTISRGGTTVASGTGVAISNTCTNGFSNFNAWVGSGSASGSISATPLSMTGRVCIKGTGVGNFGGLCDYGCSYGYCPIGACLCLSMGRQKTLPKPSNVMGYPAAGLDENYSGLCAFNCNYGYCPPSACATTKAPLTTPTVSPFLPPACTSGTGEGNYGGLCSYACNFGYCPIKKCTCTGKGGLNQPPAQIEGTSGGPVNGEDDAGLCAFACSRGYCPEGACKKSTSGGGGGGSPIYINPTIWATPTPVVSCIPPCVIVLPPYTLTAPTTISFPPIVQTITERWEQGTSITRVVTVTFPQVTTTRIPVFNLNITQSGVNSKTYTVTPSILPTVTLTITPPSSSTGTPGVIVFTYLPTSSPTYPVITGKPTVVSVTSKDPPGPTGTSGTGDNCKVNCSNCGPLGCGGICPGCGGGSGPPGGGPVPVHCVGPFCPKPGATETDGQDDPSKDNPCQNSVDTSKGLCANGNFPVWDPVKKSISCDYSPADAPKYKTGCQKDVEKDLDKATEDAQQAKTCCPAAKRDVWPLLGARAPSCPVDPDFPSNPPTNGQYHSVFTCDYKAWPNVCANAQSAIRLRGKSPIMTYAGPGGDLHVTEPWYAGKYESGPKSPTKKDGWSLTGCEVEEYPWGSGNPNRNPNLKIWSQQSVLRLIPEEENQRHGSRDPNSVLNFIRKAGNGNVANAKGLIYSVSFTNGPSGTTDKDFFLDPSDPASVDKNICAIPYGIAFLLVNAAPRMQAGERSFDPWWDNRQFAKTVTIRTNAAGSTTYTQVATTVSHYCKSPSPGKKIWDGVRWNPIPGAVSHNRARGNRYYRCDNYPGYSGPPEMRRRGRPTISEDVPEQFEQRYNETMEQAEDVIDQVQERHSKSIEQIEGAHVDSIRQTLQERHEDTTERPEPEANITVRHALPKSAVTIPNPQLLTPRAIANLGDSGKQPLTPRQSVGSFLSASAFEYLGCGNSDMDYCANWGADCGDHDDPEAGGDPTGTPPAGPEGTYPSAVIYTHGVWSTSKWDFRGMDYYATTSKPALSQPDSCAYTNWAWVINQPNYDSKIPSLIEGMTVFGDTCTFKMDESEPGKPFTGKLTCTSKWKQATCTSDFEIEGDPNHSRFCNGQSESLSPDYVCRW